MGGGKFYRGEVLRGEVTFLGGGGNNQKYCMMVGGDERSREAGWAYSGKCVIASGWVREDCRVWCLVCFVPHVLD